MNPLGEFLITVLALYGAVHLGWDIDAWTDRRRKRRHAEQEQVT